MNVTLWISELMLPHALYRALAIFIVGGRLGPESFAA